MRQELLYRGPMTLAPEQEAEPTEVWVNGETAVAFHGATAAGVALSHELALTTDGRLQLVGVDQDGAPLLWEATTPARPEVSWQSSSIAWPTSLGGGTTQAAEITATQYAVTVRATGQAPRVLVGARTETTGGQRWIVQGSTRVLANAAKRGCGCGKR